MKIYVRQIVLSVAAVAAALSVTGCGIGVAAGAGDEPGQLMAMGKISGKSFGGGLPISSATIKLWQTAISANGCSSSCSTYASPALTTPLGSATTGSDGSWNITGATACTTGQFVYLTSTGGGSNSTTNTGLVLLAALGPCATFGTGSNVRVQINEMSTIASAYALTNFAAVTGSAGSQIVTISAPYTNNATGSCTVTSNVTTACSAAGLAHAFTTANNLADYVRYDGSTPCGCARTTVPTNPNSLVPFAMMNALANSVQGCVNSATGSTQCTTLFNDSKNLASTAPTDTTQALINLAKVPGRTNASAIFGIANSQPFFGPALAATPTDWSLAIAYFWVGGTGAAAYPKSLALDASDNVYVLTSDSAASTTKTGLQGVAFDGTPTSYFYDGTGVCTVCTGPGYIATDTLGNVYATDTSVGGTQAKKVRKYSAASGTYTNFTIGGTNEGVAVDRSNNLWVVNGYTLSTTSGVINEVLQGTTTVATSSAPASTTTTVAANQLIRVQVDGAQNVWASSQTTIGVFPNTGAATSTPTYNTTTSNVLFTATLPTSANTAITFDSANDAFLFQGGTYISEVKPIVASSVITGINSSQNSTANSSNFMNTCACKGSGQPFASLLSGVLDGSGYVWVPLSANATAKLTEGTIGTSPYTASSLVQPQGSGYAPCYPQLVGSSYFCSDSTNGANTTVYNLLENLTDIAIDSAGDLWLPNGGVGTAKTGFPGPMLLEIVGAASPIWPQLSWGHPNVRP